MGSFLTVKLIFVKLAPTFTKASHLIVPFNKRRVYIEVGNLLSIFDLYLSARRCKNAKKNALNLGILRKFTLSLHHLLAKISVKPTHLGTYLIYLVHDFTTAHLTTARVEMYYKTRSRFLQKNHHFFRQINVFTK